MFKGPKRPQLWFWLLLWYLAIILDFEGFRIQFIVTSNASLASILYIGRKNTFLILRRSVLSKKASDLVRYYRIFSNNTYPKLVAFTEDQHYCFSRGCYYYVILV